MVAKTKEIASRFDKTEGENKAIHHNIRQGGLKKGKPPDGSAIPIRTFRAKPGETVSTNIHKHEYVEDRKNIKNEAILQDLESRKAKYIKAQSIEEIMSVPLIGFERMNSNEELIPKSDNVLENYHNNDTMNDKHTSQDHEVEVSETSENLIQKIKHRQKVLYNKRKNEAIQLGISSRTYELLIDEGLLNGPITQQSIRNATLIYCKTLIQQLLMSGDISTNDLKRVTKELKAAIQGTSKICNINDFRKLDIPEILKSVLLKTI